MSKKKKYAIPTAKRRSKPRKEDLRNMTMALKDEADAQKALYHPDLIP